MDTKDIINPINPKVTLYGPKYDIAPNKSPSVIRIFAGYIKKIVAIGNTKAKTIPTMNKSNYKTCFSKKKMSSFIKIRIYLWHIFPAPI